MELAREKMNSEDLQRLSATFASEQAIDEWADKTLDPGAVKWLVDLSDGDGKPRQIHLNWGLLSDLVALRLT